MRRISLAAGLAASACLMGLLLVPPAQAAFPLAENGRIAYIHDNRQSIPGLDDVFLIDSNGSNPVNVTHTTPSVEYQEPRFSPDGNWIVTNRCSNVAPSTTCDIALIRPDGSGLVDVTPTPTALEEDEPSFSPNGKQIVFSRHTEFDFPGRDIFIVNIDGSGLTQLTHTPSPAGENIPTFSPDGRTIFYSLCVGDGPCQMWKMNANGSGQVQLTNPSGFGDFTTAVSPDGTKLAFDRCDGSPTTCRILVMNLKKGQITTLDPTPSDEFSPTFSPNGKKFVFSLDLDATPGPGTDAVSVMNIGGSGLNTLTHPTGSDDDGPADWEYVYTCKGRRATKVGSDAGEKLKGTKRADVIVANGGKDTINGLGGKDRLCGGKGKDKLIGGKGKDSCLGGKGKDAAKGCEKGKV